ncbi:hypothetical protein BANRA_05207 [Klebsiella pneumoniae]|nr:hypothetical protein BANRA_05207 [Klebsiella pneumoniae]
MSGICRRRAVYCPEREGEIIATGAYAEGSSHRRDQTYLDARRLTAGLAAKVVRAGATGGAGRYSHIYLTTGFRQPEAVKLYLSQGYEAQFDLTRDPEEYSQPPYDGRLRFTKALAVSAYSHSA